jgi:hypothetical protein
MLPRAASALWCGWGSVRHRWGLDATCEVPWPLLVGDHASMMGCDAGCFEVGRVFESIGVSGADLNDFVGSLFAQVGLRLVYLDYMTSEN